MNQYWSAIQPVLVTSTYQYWFVFLSLEAALPPA